MSCDWTLIIHRISLCAAEAPPSSLSPSHSTKTLSVQRAVPPSDRLPVLLLLGKTLYLNHTRVLSGPVVTSLSSAVTFDVLRDSFTDFVMRRSFCESWGTSKELLLLFSFFTVLHKHTDVVFHAAKNISILKYIFKYMSKYTMKWGKKKLAKLFFLCQYIFCPFFWKYIYLKYLYKFCSPYISNQGNIFICHIWGKISKKHNLQ